MHRLARMSLLRSNIHADFQAFLFHETTIIVRYGRLALTQEVQHRPVDAVACAQSNSDVKNAKPRENRRASQGNHIPWFYFVA